MYTIVDVDTGEVYTKEEARNLILKTVEYEHSKTNVLRPDGTKYKRHATTRIVKCLGKQEVIDFENTADQEVTLHDGRI